MPSFAVYFCNSAEEMLRIRISLTERRLPKPSSRDIVRKRKPWAGNFGRVSRAPHLVTLSHRLCFIGFSRPDIIHFRPLERRQSCLIHGSNRSLYRHISFWAAHFAISAYCISAHHRLSHRDAVGYGDDEDPQFLWHQHQGLLFFIGCLYRDSIQLRYRSDSSPSTTRPTTTP